MLTAVIAGLVAFAVVFGWTLWRCHVLYGPRTIGSARLRREQRLAKRATRADLGRC